MIDELVEFLRTHEAQAVHDWVDSLHPDSLIRAALPPGALESLVSETYRQFISLVENSNDGKSNFSDFSYLQDHHVSGIDALLSIQTLLLKGKGLFFHLLASKIKDREKFNAYFQAIEDVFHQFILNVTSFYTRNCISPFEANLSSGESQTDASPSRLNLFYNAFQNSTDGMIITAIDGKIIEVNKAFLDIFGYDYDEVIGQTTSLLRSSQTLDTFYNMMWDSIKNTGSWKGEIINCKKGGEEIPILLSITPIYENEKIVGYMGVEIDRRKQKKMEKRLLQSERFAVIGQMASKVAHEIRNPLSSISLNAELLEDEIRAAKEAACEDAQSLLQSIMSEVDRLTKLTEEYLQFSRLPHSAPERMDLIKLITDVLNFFETEANSVGIQILVSFEGNFPKLIFDPQQIRRLILNLLRNALEAMPGGGLIKISINKNEDFVQLVVSDTGNGIPENKLSKIFEPFYTTKAMGTGLGLALCTQIVQEHGGKIWARNNEKAGTTFCVELPIKWNIKSLSGN